MLRNTSFLWPARTVVNIHRIVVLVSGSRHLYYTTNVQFLREFRQQRVLHHGPGSGMMEGTERHTECRSQRPVRPVARKERQRNMNLPVFAVLVFLGLCAVAVVLVVQYYREKERRERLLAMAREHEFSFSPAAEPTLHKSLGHFYLFSRGHARTAYNVMQGQVDDIDVTIMDYRYTTSSGKHRNTTYQTVVLFRSEQLDLPQFTLRREHALHRLAESFGHQDIDFDGHPTFSSAYLLQGPDEMRIRTVFGDEALAYFTRHDALNVEGAGRELLTYRAGVQVAPEAMWAFLQQGLDVLDLFVDREAIVGLDFILSK